MSQTLVTFILTTKHKTTYQKFDGSFHDTPVQHRIIPEFTIYDDSGTPVKCRHIRNERSIELDKQTSEFNPKRDNIYFTNGFCILDSVRDKITVDYLEKHPQNGDVDPKYRREGVFPIFRKSVPEVEGVSEIDKLMLQEEARKMVLSLAKKEGDTYVYDEATIDLLCRAYGAAISDSLSWGKKVVELEKVARMRPKEFLYIINTNKQKIESDLDMATVLNVLKLDNKNAFVNETLIFNSDKKLNEQGMKSKVIAYLLSPAGNDHYNLMIAETEKAKAKKVHEKETENIPT